MTGERARGARRRKILERGSDRLAFIIGQNEFIPPPPPPPSSSTSPTHSEDHRRTFRLSSLDEAELSKYEPNSETTSDVSDNEAAISDTMSNQSTRSTSGRVNGYELHVVNGDELLFKHENGDEVVIVDGSEDLARSSISTVAQTLPEDTVDASRQLTPSTGYQNLTPNRISSCISASENIRILCAFLIAIVVVFSDDRYSVGHKVIISLITFRPLYLVVLTDATIVWLFVAKQEHERHEKTQQTGGEESDLAKAWEVGLVLLKATRAAFVDCCICALIIIVGFPFGAKGVR